MRALQEEDAEEVPEGAADDRAPAGLDDRAERHAEPARAASKKYQKKEKKGAGQTRVAKV